MNIGIGAGGASPSPTVVRAAYQCGEGIPPSRPTAAKRLSLRLPPGGSSRIAGEGVPGSNNRLIDKRYSCFVS